MNKSFLVFGTRLSRSWWACRTMNGLTVHPSTVRQAHSSGRTVKLLKLCLIVTLNYLFAKSLKTLVVRRMGRGGSRNPSLMLINGWQYKASAQNIRRRFQLCHDKLTYHVGIEGFACYVKNTPFVSRLDDFIEVFFDKSGDYKNRNSWIYFLQAFKRFHAANPWHFKICLLYTSDAADE